MYSTRIFTRAARNLSLTSPECLTTRLQNSSIFMSRLSRGLSSSAQPRNNPTIQPNHTATPPEAAEAPTNPGKPLTSREKLRAAIRDYGSGVLVFHIVSGVTFLGMWYLVVSSGVDVNAFATKFGFDLSSNKFAQNAGTFAVAYGIHKATAPLRIGLTLTAGPLMVNYLRRKGILRAKR